MEPVPGVRHVQEEEDQVRRETPGVHPLHQLQDRMRLHAGREEEESSQGVRIRTAPAPLAVVWQLRLTRRYRAKYIEGLENRLVRMESLLRLSGMIHSAGSLARK